MSGLLAIAALGPLAMIGERGEATFRPGPGEPAVPARFRLGEESYAYEMELARVEERFAVWSLRFPSPVESPDPENNVVHADYFRPKGAAERPGAVVLHILGADFALSRYLAARLADRGVAALFVRLPYYGERRPEGGLSRRELLSGDVGRSTLAMRQGICDVRRAADWLGQRPEVLDDRVGVAGISLGGIVGSVAAGVDPEIESAALILAGGGLSDVLWEMDEPEARRFRAAWLGAGRSKADLDALTRPFDPLTHADGLRGKRVLMIAGRADEVIPPRAARALWEAAGRPEIRWYDCGHYSAVGYLLPAVREAVAFFGGGRAAPR